MTPNSRLLTPHLLHMRAGGYSPLTVRERERILRVADRGLPRGIDTPTGSELAVYLAEPSWSIATRRAYFSHLTSFYIWATSGREPYLDYNPMNELRKPKDVGGVPHPVTETELRQALERSPLRWRLIITMATYAGMRVGDICTVRREDITPETITIWKGKGGKPAILPTHPEIWKVVEPLPPGRLIPYSQDNLPIYARRHFDRIGLPEVHLHRFRHYFGTQLLRGGADIRTVQSLMRHTSLQTTARYLDVTDGQRRLAIGSLPALTDHTSQPLTSGIS